MTGNDVQEAIVSYLKSKTQITSLLANAGQVKEAQWQGTSFVYPAVRVSVDFFPAINGCQDRAEIHIEVFSEQKSSDESSTIAGAIQTLLHRKPFTSSGVSFFMMLVTKVEKPERTIYAWQTKVLTNTLLT